MPHPDFTTVTLADAHLLGGPEFVAEVRDDATAVADELAPSAAGRAQVTVSVPELPRSPAALWL